MHSIPAIGTGASLLLAKEAYADINCTPFDMQGVQTCVSGLPSWRAGSIYAAQGDSQWCWAACISMIFLHYGFDVSQQDIVSQAWGSIVNMPGSPQQILDSVNRVWVDRKGSIFSAYGSTFQADPPTAAQDLMQGMPLIIGTRGHAMVLTALTYQRDQFGHGQVVDATVRDPWPGKGRRSLSAEEWYSTQLLVRIRVLS